MKKTVARKITVILTVLFASTVTSFAQMDVAGPWTGKMVPPGFDIDRVYSFDVVVESNGEVPAGSLTWGVGNQYPLEGLTITEGSVMYTWTYLGTVMDCRMDRVRTNVYVGGCIDDLAQVGPMMIARPGLSIDPNEMTIQEAYDVLGVEPVTPEPRKQQVEIDNEGIDHAVPDGRRVTVEGLETNVVTRGSGDTTIVLEAGTGEGLRVWRDVLDGLSDVASVIAYDRPGIGFSEAADEPLTIDLMVDRLRATLDAVRAEPPYVLVGHETGAYIVRRFAAQYPDDVAGLVLIHPAHEQQELFWTQIGGDEAVEQIEQRDAFFLSMPSPVSDEYALFSDIGKRGRFEASLPDVPTTVITAGAVRDSIRWIGNTEKGRAVLRGLHNGLTAASSEGEHVVSDKAGRYVQNEDPEVVIKAIRALMKPEETSVQ